MKLRNLRTVVAALAVMFCAIASQAEVNPVVQRFIDKLNELTATMPEMTDLNQINQAAEGLNALGSTITPEEAAQPLTDEDREAMADALTDFTIAITTRSGELTGQPDPLGGMTREQLHTMLQQQLQQIKSIKEIFD